MGALVMVRDRSWFVALADQLRGRVAGRPGFAGLADGPIGVEIANGTAVMMQREHAVDLLELLDEACVRSAGFTTQPVEA
ncbi:MAG: hypothetical protein AAF389_17375 [Gemmatimonadota bacterium]